MTVYTDNAARFATRAEERVSMERRAALSDALHAIREYRDVEHAAAIMLGSCARQARWSPTRDSVGSVLIEVQA